MIAITSLYAAIAAIFLIILSINVVRNRYRTHTAIGSSDDRLTRACRAQGNFTEYVPLILLMMACAELFKVSAYIIHIAGIAMLLGRLLHAYSLLYAEPKSGGRMFFFRISGMFLTFGTLAVLALILLFVFFLRYGAEPM